MHASLGIQYPHFRIVTHFKDMNVWSWKGREGVLRLTKKRLLNEDRKDKVYEYEYKKMSVKNE